MGVRGPRRHKQTAKRRGSVTKMMIDDVPAAPVSGREKHHAKVAQERELRRQSAALKARRLRLPKSSKATRDERKELTLQLKHLKGSKAPADTDDADASMTPPPTFRYKINEKVARRAAARRLRIR